MCTFITFLQEDFRQGKNQYKLKEQNQQNSVLKVYTKNEH